MKLFKRKKSVKSIYNIISVDYSNGELVNFPNGLEDMTNHRIDGVLIRNFLTPEMTSSLIDGFENVAEDELIEAEKGFKIYPTPFAKFSYLLGKSREEHDKYLVEAEEIWRTFPENFGFDFRQRLVDCLGSMSNQRPLLNVPSENAQGHYHPAGFKRLSPDQGKFTVHCGNYFHNEFSDFFKHLKKFLPIEKQLSYFVTLQSSEEGGEIILYDVKWDEAKERLDDGKIIRKTDGTDLHLSDEKNLKRMVLKPNSGDLLIFASAQLWHKVTIPKGSARYTLGGFLGISNDDESVYMWS